jgi:hypothetical protein
MRDIMKPFHHMNHYAPQRLKMASDRMNACYSRLFNSAGSRKETKFWLYHPTRITGKLLKVQPTCEVPYKLMAQFNNVVYRIEHQPRPKMMVV